MKEVGSLLTLYKQNSKLPILLISPSFGHIPSLNIADYSAAHRKAYYFFLFMIEGNSSHSVDLHTFEVTNHQLLFILPHQIHKLPEAPQGTRYFKIGFDETCLSLLPRQYPFLINPLNNQKIPFSPAAATRLTAIFEILQDLLQNMHNDPELILAHLNSMLTEMNAAYFTTDKKPADNRLSTFIDFKQFIEGNLTDHTTINAIAEKLAVNTNSLYSIVKFYSGFSPKEFITNRLMLEAKRRLYYSETASIKELAYDLGYNDPEYFSRLFKKQTGKSPGSFVQDLSGD
jgi:AraC family transcriptional regulator, transcriptional activator of pobA